MYRIVLYILFVFLAAPFEIVLDLWYGWVKSDYHIIVRPLAEGLVYIYSFTLVIEAWFRIQNHQQALNERQWLKLLQPACMFLILAFMVDYLGTLRADLVKGEDILSSSNRQIAILTASLFVSGLSFYFLERDDPKRGKPKRIAGNSTR